MLCQSQETKLLETKNPRQILLKCVRFGIFIGVLEGCGISLILALQVLLLCGPPGLGKTTLAHVAARHCGYRVVEINASDNRSSSTLEAKIVDVVQMNSVTADPKPKCLVID